MKKKLLSAALAMVAAFGISAVAQEPAQKCQKGDSCRMEVFFEGITLTPEQQTKIAALKESRKQQKMEQAQQKRQERAERAKSHKEARRARLAEMKEILTPEQYVVYLENMVVNTPAQPQMRAARGHGHKDMKHAHGPRAERQQKGARAAK